MATSMPVRRRLWYLMCPSAATSRSNYSKESTSQKYTYLPTRPSTLRLKIFLFRKNSSSTNHTSSKDPNFTISEKACGDIYFLERNVLCSMNRASRPKAREVSLNLR